MTNPRRVRKRYPKMPDVTIDEVDDSPPPTPQAAAPPIRDTGVDAVQGDDDAPRPQRGFRSYEGVVTAAVSLWLPGPAGKPVKHYDTRIRYTGPEGAQDLKITVPGIDFLAVGTKVDVEEQNSGRIRVHRRAQATTTGASWKRPDLKAAAIALAVILSLTLVIGVIGYLIAKSKQTTDPPPAPSVTIQPSNGAPN